MTYSLKVGVLGTSEVTLTGARPMSPRWARNDPGSMAFEIDPTDPQAPLCVPIEKEVSLFRDATRIWAGQIRDRTFNASNQGVVRFDCIGLLGYFAQRNIDTGADRENYLLNPQFEDSPDLDNWTAVNTTASVTTDQHILGSKSAELVQASASQDAYLEQTITVTGTGIGSLYTLFGRFRIDPATWIGEAVGSRGMTLSRDPTGAAIVESSVFEIDGDTPRGSWQPAEAEIWVPPDAAETLRVRLYSPGGTIWWDALNLVLMESLSSVESAGDYNRDQAKIAEDIVLFLQDPAFGKDDVGITTDCPDSGVDRERHYQFADHVNGLAALTEFAEMENGGEISVTPDRVFHFDYPYMGTDRTGSVTLTNNSNCVVVEERFQGTSAASDVVVPGEGDGPAREEGGASDPVLFDGRIVQRMWPPRASTAPDTLDETAALKLREFSNPQILALRVTDASLVALLDEGDRVNVTLSYGVIQANGVYRIDARTLDLDTDTLIVECSPWTGS